MATKAAEPPAPKQATRRISATCRKCGQAFSRRTRVGKFTTCPHCGEVQPGPAGQEREKEHLGQLEEQRIKQRDRNRENMRRARSKKTSGGKPPEEGAPAPEATTIQRRQPEPNSEEKREQEEQLSKARRAQERHAGLVW